MDNQFLIIGYCIALLLVSCFLRPERQMPIISIGTAIFLVFFSPLSLALLIFLSLVSYYSSRALSLKNSTIATIISTVLIFIFYKLQFFWAGASVANNAIPIGLSYFSFRIIHYTIERYKTKLPKHTFIEYLNYLFFLPTFLVGPINLFQQFLKDERQRRWNSAFVSEGAERILYGLVKIIFLGNYLFTAKANDIMAGIGNEHAWLKAYMKIFSFSANAYVQFAGYSDIAIGLSLVMGFKIIENFNYPFLATNISDFWTRWHISLSSWCRNYVFFPILAKTRNVFLSVVISMLTLSLWHEISWRYIIWGSVHAIAIYAWQFYSRSYLKRKLFISQKANLVLGRFITLHFVIFSFAIVSEKTLAESWYFFKILFFL